MGVLKNLEGVLLTVEKEVTSLTPALSRREGEITQKETRFAFSSDDHGHARHGGDGAYLSALIGVDILKRGGNAVDAAVAAIFPRGCSILTCTPSVAEVPMLVYMAESGQVSAINGNTAAPQRASIEWFTNQGIALIPGEGLLAAGVPAAPGALITALERFGTMTLADVLQPALDLARDGFPVHAGLVGPSDYLAFSIWHCRETFQEHWPTSAQLYLPHGQLPEVGTIFRNPDLARTFERLLEVECRAAPPGKNGWPEGCS